MAPFATAPSSAPASGEGEFLIGGAAVGPVRRGQRPAGEEAPLDHRRDPREGGARRPRDRLERADVAAGEGGADELGALLVDILDAAEEDQVRGFRIEAARGERVRLA